MNAAELSATFMPHGMCFAWRPDVLALHVLADSLIALSYFCIPALLLTFVRRRPVLQRFGWLFSTFIVSCGLTHIMDVWTIWHPDYWVAGGLKAFTAVASIATAAALLPLMPYSRALRKVSDLEGIHRALESQYRLIVETSNDGLCLTDSRGNATFVNTRLSDLLGYPKTDLEGRPVAALLHDEPTPDQCRFLGSGADKGDARTVEMCLRTAQGGRLWTEVRAQTIVDADGTAVGCLIVVSDSTERREAESALAESERQYRSLAEAMPHAVFTTDAHGVAEYCNRAWSSYTGLTDTAMRETGWFHCLQDDDRERCDTAWRGALASGVGFETEFRLKRGADGLFRWFVARIVPVFGEDGTIVRWIGSCTDIHDFKVAVETRDVLDTIGHIVAIRNETTFEYVSPAWLQYTGEVDWHALSIWRDRMHPDDLIALERQRNAADPGASGVHQSEIRVRAADGTYRWFLARTVTLPTADANKSRQLQTLTDIEDLKRTQAAHGYSEAKYRALTDAMPQLVWIVDADGQLEYANERCTGYLGWTDAEIIGTRFGDVVHSDDAEVICAYQAALETRQHFEGEARLRRHDATYRWHLLRTVPLNGDSDANRKWIVTAIDIEARKVAEAALRESAAELAHRAHYDALTNLPNRARFTGQLEDMMRVATEAGEQVVVMYLDVDHFKTVNDTLGHGAGDDVLRITADRIARVLRAGDVAARFGGDEFVIACSADATDGPIIARRLGDAIREPIELYGKRLVVSSSIGVAVFPADATSTTELIQRADAAMYEAKGGGRNTWSVYSTHTHLPARPALEFEAEIREGLARGQFVVHYQPIVTAATQHLVGAEALVRWLHPSRGLLGPGEFISFAETHGLISDIGSFVLHSACGQLQRLQLQAQQEFCLSVNVSAVQFAKPGFVASIASAIDAFGIEPRRLEIEITESIVMSDTAGVVKTLAALDELGVRLSLDDFGTGYSSLAYLKNFPIHTLKIDRSFVADIDTNFTDQAIAKTTITLAHSLGMRVIGEGVETEGQLEYLRTFGADCIQGFLTGRPMEATAFEALATVTI